MEPSGFHSALLFVFRSLKQDFCSSFVGLIDLFFFYLFKRKTDIWPRNPSPPRHLIWLDWSQNRIGMNRKLIDEFLNLIALMAGMLGLFATVGLVE